LRRAGATILGREERREERLKVARVRKGKKINEQLGWYKDKRHGRN
jgi:hypothetical protein